MTDLQLLIAGLACLLTLDLLTVAARAAFLQANHARLLALCEEKGAPANRTLTLFPQLHRLKASLNLTLILARFLLAGLALFLLMRQPLAAPFTSSVGVLLVSAFIIFCLEWSIEKKVSRNPEAWALRLTFFTRIVMIPAFPGVWLLLTLSKEWQNQTEVSGSITENELKSLVDAGQQEGLFEQGERRMIYSIFQLGDTLAREIMVPRIDMLALDVSTPLSATVDALLTSWYSRVPVYEDTVDNMLGLVYAKDLLRVWREGDKISSLRELLRQPYFVPEAKKVDELLAEMQSQRIHMAIVVDEYGGIAGLVTLEDIVEEILGEIQDEYDQGEESPYQELKDGEYLFLGRIDLNDFNEIMGADLPKEEADTLGGYIYNRIGRVPNVGETIQKDNLLLTVEQVSARRIRKVRARWFPVQMEGKEEKENDDR